MDSEQRPDQTGDGSRVTPMTNEQAGELLRVAMLYMQSQGLRVNLALVLVHAGGITTVGNMPQEMMATAFRAYAECIDEAATVEAVIDPKTGKLHATH